MSGEPTSYTFKKGDKLEIVAKKHKHKDWKTIWNAKKNKALIAKRKQPDLLQKGDVIFIPATAAYVKVTEKAILNLNIYRDDRLFQKAQILKLIAAYEANIRNFEAYVTKSEKDIQKYIQELDKSRKHVKKISATVDTVNGLTNMARGLKGLGDKAYKSTKLDGKELKALNKEVEDAVKSKLLWGGLDTSRKLLELTKGTKLEPVLILSESWDKVNSWNHWFVTAAALAEGMSWSDAVTYDFDEAFKKHVDYITIHSRKMFAEWKAEIARQKKTVESLKKDIGVIEKSIRDCEDRAQYFVDQIM